MKFILLLLLPFLSFASDPIEAKFELIHKKIFEEVQRLKKDPKFDRKKFYDLIDHNSVIERKDFGVYMTPYNFKNSSAVPHKASMLTLRMVIMDNKAKKIKNKVNADGFEELNKLFDEYNRLYFEYQSEKKALTTSVVETDDKKVSDQKTQRKVKLGAGGLHLSDEEIKGLQDAGMIK